MIRVTTQSEIETLAVGRALAAALRPGDIVAIDGPLGAGKTRLVRGVALGLGFDAGVVSSPTFVVVHEYVREPSDSGTAVRGADPTPSQVDPCRMFHVDAYRLSGPDELDSLGWDRVIDGTSVVAIEWAERLGPALDAELSVWRVRMETAEGGPEGVSRTGPSDPTGEGVGRRIVTIVPPEAARERDGADDLVRLAAVLGDGPIAAAKRPLPRGWTRCATTGKPVPPDSPTFPFADARARMADLGRWMTGSYAIGREIAEDDEGDSIPPATG